MPVRSVILLIDERSAEGTDISGWRVAFAAHCRDLLSIARIEGCRAADGRACPLNVSVHALRAGGSVRALVADASVSLLPSRSARQEEDGFSALLQSLTALGAAPLASASRTSSLNDSVATDDAMQPITEFIYALHQKRVTSLSTSVPSSPFFTSDSQTLLVIGSAFLSYTHALHTLCYLCSTGLALDVHCVVADKDAVCLTRASLGVAGQLWRCSFSPTEVRQALEEALGHWLLVHAQADLRVPCRLRCGYLSVNAVAQRPYVASLDACVCAADFAAVQQEYPGLVLCGTTVLQSPFELTRHTLSRTAVLSLAAVLPPERVDDTWLCGSAWVVALPPAECLAREVAALAALHEVFRGDALVFTTTQPLLDAPHTLALTTSCFVGYFLDGARLCLRQVIPSELRASCVTSAECAASCAAHRHNSVPDPFLVSRTRQVREELVRQSTTISVQELVSGHVSQVAAQLRPDPQFHLRLTR